MKIKVDEDRGNDQRLYKKEASGTMNPERFLEGLTDEERKLYETCLSLLQSVGEEGNLEEVCGWLEKKVEKNRRDREGFRPIPENSVPR